mgnify:CR=1 FL=1
MNRRDFSHVIAGAALTAASYQRVLGANDRLRFALVGSGRRGAAVANAFLKTAEAELACVCDIYDEHRRDFKSRLQTGASIPETGAHEEALARRDVDAVILAVPDHLHLDLARDALASGKHVYLEKPATHAFAEGAELRRLVRKSGKVCQIGTQQRSGAHYYRAKEQYFDAGRLGSVAFVRAVWNDFPWQARRIPARPKPAGLDWNRFLGHAPKVEWQMARYDSWRCFKDYGAGVLADILNHWADVAQWMLSDAAPRTAVTAGGIYQYTDGRENPDTVNSLLQYGTGWNLEFESTVRPVRNERPSVVFLGTEGMLDIARDGFIFRPNKGDPVHVPAEGDLDVAHAADFIRSVKTGKKPNAGIDVALQGVLPCHMATQAYWTGRRTRYDANRNQIIGD